MFLSLAVWACIFNAIVIIPTIGRQQRLIDGSQISIEDAPYQISIYNSSAKQHHCGGSIISRHHVLTAGHCIDNLKKVFLTVRSGSANWSRNYTEHTIVTFWRHEEFNNISAANNIAVVKVKPPFEISSTTKLIRLFNKNEKVKAGQSGIVTGWGVFVRNSTNLSLRLRGLNVTIINTNDCKRIHKRSKLLVNHHICASVPGVTTGSCSGDSGSPLVIGRKQAGIVSWGNTENQTCASTKPGVYTSISDYRDWIDKHLRL